VSNCGYKYISQAYVAELWWWPIVASFSQIHNYFHTLCTLDIDTDTEYGSDISSLFGGLFNFPQFTI